MPLPQARFEREYFDTYYGDYERSNPPRKMRHYRQAVERYAPAAGPSRILDIGCAFGKFLASLASGWDLYGIDASEYAIRAARERVPRAQLVVSGNGTIPFATQFHAITAWDVLEHIPDLDQTACQIAAHLTTDGVFLFVVPVYDGPLGSAVRMLDSDPTHVHRWPRAAWLGWAARHFMVVDWWGVFRIRVPGLGYVHRPVRGLRRIAPAIAVVTRHRPLPPSPASA